MNESVSQWCNKAFPVLCLFSSGLHSEVMWLCSQLLYLNSTVGNILITSTCLIHTRHIAIAAKTVACDLFGDWLFAFSLFECCSTQYSCFSTRLSKEQSEIRKTLLCLARIVQLSLILHVFPPLFNFSLLLRDSVSKTFRESGRSLVGTSQRHFEKKGGGAEGGEVDWEW